MPRKYLRRRTRRELVNLGGQSFFAVEPELIYALDHEAAYYHMQTTTYVRVLLHALARAQQRGGFKTGLSFLERDASYTELKKEAVHNVETSPNLSGSDSPSGGE